MTDKNANTEIRKEFCPNCEAEENKSKLVYVVTMYRDGDREKHSYVLGVFSNENTAHEWGDKEKDYRGGKYEAEIIRFCVHSPTDFLKVKHV